MVMPTCWKGGSQFARNSVEVSTPYWSKFGRSLIEVSSCRVAVSNTQVYKVLVFTVFCEYMLSNCDQTSIQTATLGGRNFDRVSTKLRPWFLKLFWTIFFFVPRFPFLWWWVDQKLEWEPGWPFTVSELIRNKVIKPSKKTCCVGEIVEVKSTVRACENKDFFWYIWPANSKCIRDCGYS